MLVTGGAGFIGRHVVERLRQEGREVTIVDDFSSGLRTRLDVDPAVSVVEGTIMDERLVDALVRTHPHVIHLAAAVGVRRILADPIGCMRSIVSGTEHVLGAALRHDARVLLASSSEVYGRGTRVPYGEDDERVLGPTTVTRWSYATAKALAEHMALASVASGLQVSVVRFFNVYGPGMSVSSYGAVVPRFLTQALRAEALTVYGDGSQTRTFTYVTDAVDGALRAGFDDAALGRVYNIGHRAETSILALADTIRRLTGSRSEVRFVPLAEAYGPGFEETARRVADTARATSELGFVARVALDDGLRATRDWLRS